LAGEKDIIGADRSTHSLELSANSARGSHAIAEIHYGPTTQTVEDRGTLGVYFVSKPDVILGTTINVTTAGRAVRNSARRMASEVMMPTGSSQ
jgi:hypothetical protein